MLLKRDNPSTVPSKKRSESSETKIISVKVWKATLMMIIIVFIVNIHDPSLSSIDLLMQNEEVNRFSEYHSKSSQTQICNF